ncbi:YHYH protein [Roseiarcus fermentans]|uniref:YHYH protein n=1 Tax=Roseiarcus fermentans TaxID=1473586 RepID=A0A366EUJ4_9HYPH|nr:YHYH protein [Roseiarcus fermentans]RBP05169.1 YHYH protein [Roseiarcus fermentans]
MNNDAPRPQARTRTGLFVTSVLGAGLALAPAPGALAHEGATSVLALAACDNAGLLTQEEIEVSGSKAAAPDGVAELTASALWRNVLSHLLVSRDKANPCFGHSDTRLWDAAVSQIPADIVGVQTTKDRESALIYVAGIPDYLLESPQHFTSFKPGNTYGIFKIDGNPVADERKIHDLASKGAIGFLVNGISIFNYTDTFSYNDKGAWSYEANVAEAAIVNSDVAHATPSDIPQLPKSRGILHNHQMSRALLKQLQDPYALGVTDQSKVVGFAIDSIPIYGPLGYSTKDASSGVKVLKSSYAKRSWLADDKFGAGHRSSLPEWVVLNWDGSNEAGANLLNLFRKPKSDMLLSDASTAGAVSYAGSDAKLAAEIALLEQKTTLLRDDQGFVYWQSDVVLPDGQTKSVRNYLLKSSDLWGPDIGQEVLPATYQVGDKEKFLFTAVVGSFAEDYEFVEGYGDLDFFNGTDSYIPARGGHAYHYVATFGASVSDEGRLSSASFPYFVGIQYRSKPDPFNEVMNTAAQVSYLKDNAARLETIFDLGVVGRDDKKALERASVIQTWRRKLTE